MELVKLFENHKYTKSSTEWKGDIIIVDSCEKYFLKKKKKFISIFYSILNIFSIIAH